MIVKLDSLPDSVVIGFESRVVLDGSQTLTVRRCQWEPFESRVVLDGSQTARMESPWTGAFESRVVLNI